MPGMSREGAGVAPAWSLADALVLAGAPAGGVTSTSGGMRVPALRALAEPHGHVDPAVGARLASEPPHPPRPDGLSEREAEVLERIALGETNAEIAGHLNVSVRTVETHRAHIQQKTGCASRSQLVRYARRHGILSWLRAGPGALACGATEPSLPSLGGRARPPGVRRP